MRTTIDAAGRIVVPKTLRDQLGFAPGTELEVDAVDGRLEVVVPSRVRVERGPHGVRLVAGDEPATPLTADEVRDLLDRGRR
ncbi:MAG TPA: AbrB/MazE/SpoVT family DNA-binding domain-containing protein [Solirubrobacteraceae bacterium]|nr:AbrB/MazE/SpoVT family DNA-binding domain-containing protein [Solirubrobacteraceae bacterium]